MFEYLEAAYLILNEPGIKKVSVPLLMRRFKLGWDAAEKLAAQVRLKQHLEGRRLAKELENG